MYLPYIVWCNTGNDKKQISRKNVVYIDIDYDINSLFGISKGMFYYNKVAFDLIHTKPTKDNKNDAFLK